MVVPTLDISSLLQITRRIAARRLNSRTVLKTYPVDDRAKEVKDLNSQFELPVERYLWVH